MIKSSISENFLHNLAFCVRLYFNAFNWQFISICSLVIGGYLLEIQASVAEWLVRETQIC